MCPVVGEAVQILPCGGKADEQKGEEERVDHVVLWSRLPQWMPFGSDTTLYILLFTPKKIITLFMAKYKIANFLAFDQYQPFIMPNVKMYLINSLIFVQYPLYLYNP